MKNSQYPLINHLDWKDDSDIHWVHCGGTGLVLPELEFVKEWVMKSSKVLLTFADIPHRSWRYLGILTKDKDFKNKSCKFWLDSKNNDE